MKSYYDAVIIGAGHNGLVAASYLARAGLSVLVVERRHVVGGAAVTEEVFPGCKVSRLSYVNGIFQPRIARELRLHAYGLEVLPRNPSSFTPFPDGRHLLMGPDHGMNVREIGKFSAKDAEAYPRYEAMLDRLAKFIEPTLLEPPPDPVSNRITDLLAAARTGLAARGLGSDMGTLVRILTGSARNLLDDWFESPELKVTLATDAIIGAFAAPSQPGTAYVLFHHVMGETNGVRGVWGYVRGGMGALSGAIAAAARDMKVDIECDAPVTRIEVRGGRACGVVLRSGQEITTEIVLSNADANITFLKLVGAGNLPGEFVEAVRNIRYDSASVKINVLLDELPSFTAYPHSSRDPGPQHRGTIHISPDMDYIERAYDDAKYGRPSASPILECTIPSTVDDTVSPAGKYLMNMFVQYGPYDLKVHREHAADSVRYKPVGGRGTPADSSDLLTWDDIKSTFGQRCIEVLSQYAPNVEKTVVAMDVVSPLDMEREYSLTGGSIFQGAMTLDQLAFMRPVFGYSNYATPIKGLYLCGAAAHPGGGVMGACGYNAAKRVLGDLGRR